MSESRAAHYRVAPCDRLTTNCAAIGGCTGTQATGSALICGDVRPSRSRTRMWVPFKD